MAAPCEIGLFGPDAQVVARFANQSKPVSQPASSTREIAARRRVGWRACATRACRARSALRSIGDVRSRDAATQRTGPAVVETAIPCHESTVLARRPRPLEIGDVRPATMTKAALEHPLFKDNTRLQSCLHHDKDHVQFGDVGDFVFAIQMALMTVDRLAIDPVEVQGRSFGDSTRKAVVKYKDKRKIINFSYEQGVDPIVGKMTIERLDDDLLGRKHTSNPLTDPGEPARIAAVLNRERPAVTRIVDRSIALLRELRDAIARRNEEPGTLLQFEAKNPLVMDALRRFCGMSFREDSGVVEDLLQQYEAFKFKLPNLASDQKAIDFSNFLIRFPANVEVTPDGPTFPPAISDAPNGMFFTPRYRDVDSTEPPLFRGMVPAILELMQLHEMGHFYFGFADGDPRGKSFAVSKRFAQTYEFFSKQAVFHLMAP
jgi:hypothetical protein